MLEKLQNQLPVLEAVGGGMKMAAQYAADYANAMDQGKSATDAAALAAGNLQAAQAQVNSSALEQLASLRDQSAVAGARNVQEGIRAQGQVALNGLLRQGVDYEIASAVASQQTANAKKQVYEQMQKVVRASQDQVDLALAGDDATRAMVQSTIAWRDAMQAGATASQAAAISVNVLEVGLLNAAKAADQLAQAEEDAYRAAHKLTQGTFVPEVMPTGQLSFSAGTGGGALSQGYYANGGTGKRLSVGFALNNIKAPELGDIANKYVGQGDISGAITAVEAAKTGSVDDKMSLVDSLTQLLNGSTSDKGTQVSNLQSELAWLNTLPETIARDQKIISLQQSIDQLKNSTDGLNSTMGDLLSPYYSQDPRTSHIGFRSQGMASGGYVDVPGAPSANDNMIATIPVASGERIYVDPMPSKRGVGVGGTTISINMPVTIQGNANKDEVGRTMYQVGQSIAKQLQASAR